jgi:hypothetical protein
MQKNKRFSLGDYVIARYNDTSQRVGVIEGELTFNYQVKTSVGVLEISINDIIGFYTPAILFDNPYANQFVAEVDNLGHDVEIYTTRTYRGPAIRIEGGQVNLQFLIRHTSVVLSWLTCGSELLVYPRFGNGVVVADTKCSNRFAAILSGLINPR